MIRFFASMIPPTITAQQKKVRVVNGKPILYEAADLKAAREKLRARLGEFAPPEPYSCGLRMVTKWCFPRGRHQDGSYRTTKPDTDNLQKMLKDVMQELGFFTNDALVASEIIEKFWAEHPGIFVQLVPLELLAGEGDAQ